MARAVKEWIGKSDDERPPPRVRLRIFDDNDGRCYITGRKIRPGDLWEADHIIAIINGGENRESNLAPVLKDKHREKTARDVAEKSAVADKRKKHLGIRKPSHPMPGSRAHPSKLRRRMSGNVERWPS